VTGELLEHVVEADGQAELAEQVLAGIDRPVTVHGIRHSFHDLARQQGVPDAVVKAMAGRAGAEVRTSTCTTAEA
jgi:hypothetical protein